MRVTRAVADAVSRGEFDKALGLKRDRAPEPTPSQYAEVPGVAGVVLRTAERFGLAIRPTDDVTANDTRSWAIDGNGPDDVLYVTWTPRRTRHGRTDLFRPRDSHPNARRGSAVVRVSKAQALGIIGTLHDTKAKG